MATEWYDSTRSGLSGGYLYGIVNLLGTNVAGNMSQIRCRVAIYNDQGNGPAFNNNGATWSIAGMGTSGSGTWTPAIPYSEGQNIFDLTFWVGHFADGTLSGTVSMTTGATGTPRGGPSTVGVAVALPSIPRTPTSLSASRVSDARIDLAWTRVSSSTAVVVQRRTDAGSWVEIGRPGGNAAAFSDTTCAADHKYEYRVAAVLSGYQSAFTAVSSAVYTSPAAPTSVSAARAGSDIVVSATGLPPYATSYDIQDDGTTVATGVALPWTHTSPSTSAVHKYRVRGKVGTLAGAWSAYSNSVQLISPPNPPTGLSPNGTVAPSDEDVRFAWLHNPVDSSPQSAYQIRYRVVGAGSWTTVSGTTAAYRDVPLTAADYEWQARTKGADASYGDWSALATFTVIGRPTVAINSPGSTLDAPTVTPAWAYSQAQALPQSSWQAELLDSSSGLLESLSGSDAASTISFGYRLEDATSYEVKVRAATGAIWSAWASQLFTTDFTPPATPTITASWDDTLGGVPIEVAAGVDASAPDTVSVLIERQVDDVWETVFDGAAPVTMTDWESPSHGDVDYRVTAYADTGAGASASVTVTADSGTIWLSGGPSYGLTARLPFDPKIQVTAGRARAVQQYEGRALPVAYAGEALARQVDVSGTIIHDDADTATVAGMVTVGQAAEPLHLYRDPDGRRIYGALSSVVLPRDGSFQSSYSFTLTETGH